MPFVISPLSLKVLLKRQIKCDGFDIYLYRVSKEWQLSFCLTVNLLQRISLLSVTLNCSYVYRKILVAVFHVYEMKYTFFFIERRQFIDGWYLKSSSVGSMDH